MLRTYSAHDFPRPRLAAAKRGRTVSVVVPARDEAPTVGRVVQVATALTDVVDEVIVVDDGSADDTAAVAAAAGARVLSKPGEGKGQAMRAGLDAANGDIVVFLDADLRQLGPGFVLGLLGPLLLHDDVALVKAFYQRPLGGKVGEGGRVTELVARPLLSLLFPELAAILQPLGGEYASRRSVLERLHFEGGYSVDVALLIDVAEVHGVHSLAQVDLGTRVHRNRPLAELSYQAREVMEVVLERAGVMATPYRRLA
ncbi:MAG TPA: glucosyl-3-phosphoglycerate synthase [Acidimicrobiales bacterium]|nr:glucosyl-3-phosphoglycerate synthase [Acidimicrobiales bacterium]